MNVNLKFNIGQTVYRIENRAAQVGTVESYTIKLSSTQTDKYIEEYVIAFYGTPYPTRVLILFLFLILLK